MVKYQYTVRMDDGSMAIGFGLFATSWDVIDMVMTTFPDAKRITPRRLA